MSQYGIVIYTSYRINFLTIKAASLLLMVALEQQGNKAMKKIISSLLIIVLAFSIISTVVFANDNVTVNSKESTTTEYVAEFNNVKYKTLVDLGLTDVQVTLDGFSKTHNKTRHLANREGTWNVIIQNLKKISQYPKHSKIILRTNFNSEVIESEKKFLII